ncbi:MULTISPECIES: hypothetical protein [unclassified Bradyrhizobium]|uniref:hypothetical protein n=1 Tax=unclassified Bradyrhizobium TaxID=2631580 RepID=UPI00247A105D|nr:MULTISPECIES: hypothetical protein [unclassified Bradyrhizobium]WGS21149.1 hypothetical protein MTX22_05180 [Bradyrhizobium sp. ISRA463]WGS28071.1 hypothetical protein MTX19_03025 [Bradyrhizobium sp. ISRA464]
MAFGDRSLLSPALHAKLSAVGKALGRSGSDQALREALADLATLPATEVVRASREIAWAAGLDWWRQPSLRETLLRWLSSEQTLMARNPDYAWLFLFHPDGRVRELALDHLETPPGSQFFFAALAWRLNDWVGPVRLAAQRCVQRVASQIPATVAADTAKYLLGRRLIWGRWHDTAASLDLVYGRDDVLSEFVSTLEKQPSGASGAHLRNALRFSSLDRYLPHVAEIAIEPAIRAVAYQCLISGRATWLAGFEWIWIDKVYGLQKRVPVFDTRDIKREHDRVFFIARGVRDKSPVVRRAVADAMISVRSQIDDEAPLVARLADDPNPAVRSRADFMLRHPPPRKPP